MPLESVTHISDLVPTNPVGATDPKSQGDDHLRNIKLALKTDFPNITGVVSATQAQLNVLSGTGQALLADGTAGAPSHSFANDPDCGLLRAGVNQVQLSIGGIARWDFSTTRNYTNLPLRVDPGSVGAPSFSFEADTDTGLYRQAENVLGVSIGGGDCVRFGVQQLQLSDGSALTPAANFIGDTDTGMYRAATNRLGFATGGSSRLLIDTTFIESSLILGTVDGAVGAPGFYFSSDPNTGIYRIGADNAALVAGATASLQWNATQVFINAQLLLSDGSAGTPAIGFNTQNNTGFYRSATSKISMSVNGTAEDITAESGSFTFTATGLTTSPTGTGRYVKHGNLVTLFLPAISGTSNATTFT